LALQVAFSEHVTARSLHLAECFTIQPILHSKNLPRAAPNWPLLDTLGPMSIKSRAAAITVAA